MNRLIQSRAAFEAWTQSDAFRKAHANAHKTPHTMYAGPPQLELFSAVLTDGART